MLQQITDLILGASTTVWGYLGLAVFVILDAVIPLFPSESLVISMASVLVHDHQVLLIVLFLVAAAAAWVGDNLAFMIDTSSSIGSSAMKTIRDQLTQVFKELQGSAGKEAAGEAVEVRGLGHGMCGMACNFPASCSAGG